MITTRLLGRSLPILTLIMVLIGTGSALIDRPPTKRETKLKDVPKPANITCYECRDELVPLVWYNKGKATCTKFRDLWRKFVHAKDAHAASKSNYRDELLVQLKREFGKKCPYGTEDCYLSRPSDPRIAGWEHRGCGSGPESIDAEPGEGCTTEKQKKTGEKMDILNCVCDEKTNDYKGYCNKGVRLGKGWGTPWILLGALHLLWPVIN